MESRNRMINADYQFLAPKLLHYRKKGTDEQMNRTMFHRALSYDPSYNTKRIARVESLFDFNEAENSKKEPEPSSSTSFVNNMKKSKLETEKQRNTGLKNKVGTPYFAQGNQVIKEQKLKTGEAEQISSSKTCSLPHKARAGKKIQRKPKMTHTMFKEPTFETFQCTGSVKIRSSTELEEEDHQRKPHLTTLKIPLLQTSLRPSKIISSQELEKRQLEKAPKFKARPLNKKILESKGELGLLRNKKRQVTVPQEFHFAIDERIPQSSKGNSAELYDKIAMCLESHKKLILRNTIPHPFHLRTEERGARKQVNL